MRRPALALCLVALTGPLASCAGHGPGRGPAITSLMTNSSVLMKPGVTEGDGLVIAYTANTLEVRANITVDRVEPVVPAAGVRLLTTRFAYSTRALDGATLATTIGGACFTRWPPAGFGPSFPAHGAQLRRGDSVTLLVYIAAQKRGDWQVRDLRVHYHRGRKGAAVRLAGANLDVLVAAPGEALPEGRVCDEIVPTWSTPPKPDLVCFTRPDVRCRRHPFSQTTS
jgi:hypothetical protein